MNTVIRKIYPPPKINMKEILRYSGVKKSDDKLLSLTEECIREVSAHISYKVCYKKCDISHHGDTVYADSIPINSKNLLHTLKDCNKALIFCATLGLDFDRMLRTFSSSSPSKAVIIQAIGAERIEALCDAFSRDMESIYNKKGLFLKPRFSPGYGDFDLSFQKEVSCLLNFSKEIGVTVNSSYILSPSKSVTAIIGLSDKECKKVNNCNLCTMTNCPFKDDLRND